MECNFLAMCGLHVPIVEKKSGETHSICSRNVQCILEAHAATIDPIDDYQSRKRH
jgi:hypothetical protein